MAWRTLALFVSGIARMTFPTSSGASVDMRKRYRSSGQSGKEVLPSEVSFSAAGGFLKKPRWESGAIHWGFFKLSKKYAAAPGFPKRARAESTNSLVGVFKDVVQFVQVVDSGCR